MMMRSLGAQTAMSSPDDEVLGPSSRSRRGRRAMGQSLGETGRPALAFVVASETGRWCDELACGALPCKAFCKLLHEAADGLPGPSPGGQEAWIVGLMVVQGWRFVSGEASHVHTFAMMEASKGLHRRRGAMKFLEHMVLDSAFLRPEGQRWASPGATWLQGPAGFAGQGLLRQASESQLLASIVPGVGQQSLCMPLPQLLERWRSLYGVFPESVFRWPVAPKLAAALIARHVGRGR